MTTDKYVVFPLKSSENERLLLRWSIFCPKEDRTVAACRELKDAELIVNALNSYDSAIETIKLYHDAWKSLYDVMCDFGMDPKLGPEEMVDWLRNKFRKAVSENENKTKSS